MYLFLQYLEISSGSDDLGDLLAVKIVNFTKAVRDSTMVFIFLSFKIESIRIICAPFSLIISTIFDIDWILCPPSTRNEGFPLKY